MKIIIISHSMVVDIYRKKLRYLADNGRHELLLITPKRWREGGSIVEPQNDNRDYQHKTVPHYFGYHGAKFIYGISLYQTVKQFNPNILYVEEEYFGLAAFQAAWLRTRINPHMKLVFFTSQTIYNRYPYPFRATERYVLRQADGMLGVSSEVGEVLRRKGFTKPYRTLPLVGVEREPIANGLHEDRTPMIIGYIGRLVPEKGVDTLFRATKRLRFPFEIRVIGSGPEKAALKKLSRELEIENRVRWFGNLSHAEIPAEMTKMHAIVLPSRTQSNWKEKFGRVITEAMACGVPIIGASSGAIPEVIGDAGLIFGEDDYDELQRHLESLHTDPTLPSKLVRLGHERVAEKFSHEKVAEGLHRFLQEIALS